jgi:hypothetical protein
MFKLEPKGHLCWEHLAPWVLPIVNTFENIFENLKKWPMFQKEKPMFFVDKKIHYVTLLLDTFEFFL